MQASNCIMQDNAIFCCFIAWEYAYAQGTHEQRSHLINSMIFFCVVFYFFIIPRELRIFAHSELTSVECFAAVLSHSP